MYCRDCDRDYCVPCSANQHMSTSSAASHVRVPIVHKKRLIAKGNLKISHVSATQQAEIDRQKFMSNRSQMCEKCHQNPKGVYCHACRKELCVSCSTKMHSAPAMGNHNRVSLEQKETFLERLSVDPKTAYVEAKHAFRPPHSIDKSKWIPDSDRDECHKCMVKFTTTKRRHHCRLCGEVFCHADSNHWVVLRFEPDEYDERLIRKGRVCQSCMNDYEKAKGDAIQAATDAAQAAADAISATS
jgi:FYVE zinc finger/B-box zinc finger